MEGRSRQLQLVTDDAMRSEGRRKEYKYSSLTISRVAAVVGRAREGE